jgi:hypothetical protein
MPDQPVILVGGGAPAPTRFQADTVKVIQIIPLKGADFDQRRLLPICPSGPSRAGDKYVGTVCFQRAWRNPSRERR